MYWPRKVYNVTDIRKFKSRLPIKNRQLLHKRIKHQILTINPWEDPSNE